MAKKQTAKRPSAKRPARAAAAAAAAPRRAAAPDAAREVWIAGVATVPERLDVAGLYELALVVGPKGVRAVAPGLAPLTDDALRKAALQALRAPLPPGRPATPAAVLVPTAAAAAALASLALEHGFTVTVDPQVDPTAMLAALPPPPGGVVFTSSTLLGVPRPLEARFAAEAARFASTRPWERFAAEVVLHVARPAAPLAHPYAVIMGGAGILRGLSLYQHPDALASLGARGARPAPEQLPSSLMFELEPAPAGGNEVAAAFKVRGYPVAEGGYPFAMQVQEGRGGPIAGEPLARELLFATAGVAAFCEATARGESGPVAFACDGDPGTVAFAAPGPAPAPVKA